MPPAHLLATEAKFLILVTQTSLDRFHERFVTLSDLDHVPQLTSLGEVNRHDRPSGAQIVVGHDRVGIPDMPVHPERKHTDVERPNIPMHLSIRPSSQKVHVLHSLYPDLLSPGHHHRSDQNHRPLRMTSRHVFHQLQVDPRTDCAHEAHDRPTHTSHVLRHAVRAGPFTCLGVSRVRYEKHPLVMRPRLPEQLRTDGQHDIRSAVQLRLHPVQMALPDRALVRRVLIRAVETKQPMTYTLHRIHGIGIGHPQHRVLESEPTGLTIHACPQNRVRGPVDRATRTPQWHGRRRHVHEQIIPARHPGRIRNPRRTIPSIPTEPLKRVIRRLHEQHPILEGQPGH